MRHPVPARLKAYALHQIDFGGEVAAHLKECEECDAVVAQELMDAPESPEFKALADSMVSDPKRGLEARAGASDHAGREPLELKRTPPKP